MKTKKTKPWKLALGTLLGVLSAGYGINVGINPTDTQTTQEECILEYGQPYTMIDKSIVVIHKENAIYTPHGE